MPKRMFNKKKKAVKLSPSERALAKLQSDHRTLIRNIFRAAGFLRISAVSDRQFSFEGQNTDFDDVYIFENIIIFAEYTCQSSHIGDHLKKKKIVYDKILSSPVAFLKFIKRRFPSVADTSLNDYHDTQAIVRILYCSRHELDFSHKRNVPGPVYMDYPTVRYFSSVSQAIKKSCRFELMSFLGIDSRYVGSSGKVKICDGSQDYKGSILPEAHSHFDEGYKVVSFYADPEVLLRTSYVLRKDGWRDSLNLYQRMVSSSKIEAVRQHLKKEKRVFINNIIVTLPPEVKPLNEKYETIDTLSLNSTAPVIIKLPDKPNTVGLIDGQHRVFAYHEANSDDPDIAQLRKQQNLLVTGIIYPEWITTSEREKFEAKLFLEINSTQTSAKSSLRQAIGMVLDPFSNESIAARVLNGLSTTGPLSGYVEQYFFDKGKLKTSSIVAFGLRPLVKTSGNDSLFSAWPNLEKNRLAERKDEQLLNDYIEFCVSSINGMLVAIKTNLPTERWTTDKRVRGRILSTTYVNSFLITLRLLIFHRIPIDQKYLSDILTGIGHFDFYAYHSSQYARMAEKIVEQFFPDALPRAINQ